MRASLAPKPLCKSSQATCPTLPPRIAPPLRRVVAQRGGGSVQPSDFESLPEEDLWFLVRACTKCGGLDHSVPTAACHEAARERHERRRQELMRVQRENERLRREREQPRQRATAPAPVAADSRESSPGLSAMEE